MSIRLYVVLGITACVVQAATLSGVVLDAQGGEALARVRVQLIGAERETLTDGTGRFAFADLSTGSYSLHAETVGYRLLKRAVELSGEDLSLQVVLSPDTFRRTDTVEVRAGAFEPVAENSPSEHTLVASEVKNLGTVLMDDPVRALHSMPGVTVNDDFYAQFSVRGAPFQRVGFYLDDILLHQPFHTLQGISDAGSTSILNTDMLETMALLPSAFPSRYGDRTGAAVDVRSREGSRTKRNVRGSLNLASVTGMTEGPIGRRGSYVLSARKSYLQHLVSRVSDDAALAIGFADLQSRLSFDITDRQTLTLHVMEGTTEVDRSAARNRSGVNALVIGRYHPTIARTGWRWTPGTGLVVNAAAAWMRERFDNFNREDLRLGSGLYGEWVGLASLTWQPQRGHSFDAGYSARRLRDAGYAVQFFANSTNVRLRDEYGGTALRDGAYVQHGAQAGRLRVAAGFRWDRHELSATPVVTPQASASLRLAGSTALTAGWGQYVQFPEIWMLTTPLGGTRLLPERSTHATLGIEQRLGGQTRLRLEAFERQDRDLLARPLLDPRISPETGRVVVARDLRMYNSVRGYARGAQIVFQRRSANRVTGWIGYTLLFTRQRDGIERLSFTGVDDQRHTVNTWLSYRVRPSLNVSAGFNYGSGFPIPGFIQRTGDTQYTLVTERNAHRLSRYARLDLRANKSFTYDRWKFTLYAETINVTNQRNVRINSFDGVDTRTGRAFVSLLRVFPILPSGGLMVEF